MAMLLKKLIPALIAAPVLAGAAAAHAGDTGLRSPNDDTASLAFDGQAETLPVAHRGGFHAPASGFRGSFGFRGASFGFRQFNHFGNGFRFRRFDRFEDRLENRLRLGRFDRFEDRFENRFFFRRFAFDRFEDRFENRFFFRPFANRFFFRPFAFDRFEDRFENRFFFRRFAFDRFEDRFENRFFFRPFARAFFFRPFVFDRFEDRFERRFFLRPLVFDRFEDRFERRFFFRPFGFDRMTVRTENRFGRLDGPALERSGLGGVPRVMPHAISEPPARASSEVRTPSPAAKPAKLVYLAYGERPGQTIAAAQGPLPIKSERTR
jgi:hypothetical protein